jgi:hypothetical protein
MNEKDGITKSRQRHLRGLFQDSEALTQFIPIVLYLTTSNLKGFFFTRIGMAQYATSGLVLFCIIFCFF